MRLRGSAGVLAMAALLAATGELALAQTEPAPPFQSVPQSPAPAPAPTPIVRPPTPPVVAALPPEEPAAPAPVDVPPPSARPAPPPALRRTLYTAAVLQVLDKVTAETLRFEAPLHKPVRYKGLIFVVNTCQSGAVDQPKAAAHLEIDSQPIAMPGRPENPIKTVYRGWMFADTPGPHVFEHPVYDAWLIACKMAGS